MGNQKQLTINDLKQIVDNEVKNGNGNKILLISNDVEGNGYHGLFYGITSDTKEVKTAILLSNGVSDTQETNHEKLAILG